MNRHAMLHVVDSAFCFPISEKEIVIRLRTANNDIKKAELIYESKYNFGMFQQRAKMTKKCTTELYDFFEIKLELSDTRLAYVFNVFDGDKYYYFSENGITEEYDFKYGFYNFFQYPYINEADIMRPVEWMKKAVFYQIFVDRFNQGNRNKDMSYINCKWGDVPNPKSFAGGDIKGITEKLDYIKMLGCDTIYLTPIFKSISNHKYDISDYYEIDEHFGTDDDLQELVKEAHKRGMKLILDAVFNHCSEGMRQFKDVLDKGSDSEYFDWFVIYGDKVNEQRDNYEMFASCEYMPKLNTSNPKVQKYLIDVAVHYIEKYHIDGWRLDVSDEVSKDFWRAFRKGVKAADTNAVIIGENWHDAYSNLRGDQYDSIMNYSFTKACLDYFAFERFDAKQLAWRLNEILMRNNSTVNSMMLNLLDSHDTHRFFSEVKEDEFKLKAALCLTYLFPGAPCIFYGTEIMMVGGYDPDCRRCMDWDKADKGNEVISLIKKLSEIRQKYNVSDGDLTITEENGTFVYVNKINGDTLKLLIDSKSYSVELNERVII